MERLFQEHSKEHQALANQVDTTAAVIRREFDGKAAEILEMARLHAEAHKREHYHGDVAVQKAYETMDKRLEGMNEFRDQLRDQAATFARRDYVDTVIAGVTATLEARSKSNSDRIDTLERKEANLAGRFTAMGIGVALVVIIINVILRFL